MDYDAIVIGAGSAGAVIAARLSEDAARRVLVLEAGPDYPDLDSTPQDLRNGRWNSTRAHDWRFRAHHTSAGRPHAMPRGRVVGGSSAVNTAIALRGVPEDYDEWAELGNPEWSWQRVLPYFRGMENDQDYAGDFHGRHGPLPVVRYKEHELVPWQAAFMAACGEAGLPIAQDNNDPESTGAAPHPMNRQGSLRISTAIAYLAAARSRPNLEIRGDTHVRRVLLSAGRAAGVEVEGGEAIFARQVVLCAGAFQSPALLVRSGMGDPADLTRLGLECRVALPGVGKHLLDHPVAGVAFVPRPGACPVDVPSVQVTYRYTASGSADRNDMQVMPVSFVQTATGPVFSIGACLERVRGEGCLVVDSLDARAQPRIESHFCEDPEDLRRMVEGIRLAVQLGETEALRTLHQGILRPRAHHLASDNALGDWIRTIAGSGYHPCGTAKMGPATDPFAVVDQFGRVHGVEGLVVADASIFPSLPRANTNFTSIMVGERVGEWLRDGVIKAPAGTAAASRFDVARSLQPERGDRRGPFTVARDRGADYLERRQQPNGMIGDSIGGEIRGYYKAPWAMAAAGRSRSFGLQASWIRERGESAIGDHSQDNRHSEFDTAYPYPSAWLAAGLQRGGAFDLSARAMDFVRTLQDPESGGLYTHQFRAGSDARQDVMCSAMAGIAALATGRTDIAHGVARFLRTILAGQSAPERVLYHTFTRATGVITEFEPGRESWFAVYADRPRQAYFNFGIGAAFFVRYHQATGDVQALRDAEAFLAPAHNAIDAMYETAQVGKVAWGAALLAGVTRDERQCALALRAAGALLEQQNPDGSWDNTGGYSREEMRDEVTAEFVAIMDEVDGGLAFLERDEQRRRAHSPVGRASSVAGTWS